MGVRTYLIFACIACTKNLKKLPVMSECGLCANFSLRRYLGSAPHQGSSNFQSSVYSEGVKVVRRGGLYVE